MIRHSLKKAYKYGPFAILNSNSRRIVLQRAFFSTSSEAGGELLWQPKIERIESSALTKFSKIASTRAGKDLSNYWDLHTWSIQDPSSFWDETAAFVGVKWRTRGEQVCVLPEKGRMRGTQWFPGSTLNFAENLMPANNDQTAIVSILETPDGGHQREEVSGAAVWAAAAATAGALQRAGVGPGARVAGVLTNGPAALTAMLGATALGAVWSSCSPDFGVNGIVDRLVQTRPEVVFFSEAYGYNGRWHDCRPLAAEVASRLPPGTRFVLVPAAGGGGGGGGGGGLLPPGGQEYAEFLSTCPGDYRLEFEPLPFDHPVYIMFSSGTTGMPKCIVHRAGGVLLNQKKELALHCDLAAGDRMFFFTTCGWMMWNWMAAGLGTGSSLVTLDGAPGHPDLGALWRLAGREGVTHLGTSPKFLQACMNRGVAPAAAADLGALRSLLSTGSPLLPEHAAWVHAQVKRDVHLASMTGGTDLLGCFMCGAPTVPVFAGEIQVPALGMAVEAWNDDSQPVTGQKAELVCIKPFPSMPLGFLDDPGDERYSDAYFDHFSNDQREVWRQGDFIEITKNKGYIVHGRSDSTLNPGGVRIGTSELYRQVENFEVIEDSIAVGKKTDDGDVEVVLFIKMKDEFTLQESLVNTLKQQIRNSLTPRHVPKYVLQVADIPYTRSGKKVEGAVTKAIHGEEVKNTGAMANPECLEEYYQVFQ